MRNIRPLIIFVLLTILPVCAFGKDLTIITNGEGSTKDEAITNALSIAVEQAYGTFISAETTILNDELVKDEVVSLKRGNVKKYKVLAEVDADSYGVTIEAVVSLDKLLKFAQNNGSECELAGNTFAENLKLNLLHLENASKTMESLYSTLGCLAKQMYDYKLVLSEPILDGDNVYIPIAIDCSHTDNAVAFYNMYNQTKRAINQSISGITPRGSQYSPLFDRINDYTDKILTLPMIWSLGFKIYDNNGGSIIPKLILCGSENRETYNQNWPDELIEDIGRNTPFVKGLKIKTFSETYSWRISNTSNKESLDYSKKDVCLDYKTYKIGVEKLCNGLYSNSPYSGYVSQLAYGTMVPRGYTLNLQSFESYINNNGRGVMMMPFNPDSSMPKFPNRFNQATKVGEKIATVHMILVYPASTIAKISSIKVAPIWQEIDLPNEEKELRKERAQKFKEHVEQLTKAKMTGK